MVSLTALHALRDDELITPPDVTAAGLREALTEMAKEVGDNNVIVHTAKSMKPDTEGQYYNLPKEHDLFYILEKEHFLASAVVSPGSTVEVSAIVKLANKYLTPLWPVSMGRNLGESSCNFFLQPYDCMLTVYVGYGGSAPRLRGSIVLDMGHRMNRVLEVSDRDCTCLLEPGVSYFDLYNYLQSNGHKQLWIDNPDLGVYNPRDHGAYNYTCYSKVLIVCTGGGSVIGNTLDRGAGYTPYGEHFSMHCGMEVVLPNGEVMRTGMGALPGNNTWQTFQYGQLHLCFPRLRLLLILIRIK